MNLYVQTLGCKVNAVESAGIAALFAAQGFTVCEDPALADVILLNSCTVTASGDSRMRRALRQLRAAAPDAVLILTGCYAQAFPEDAAALPEPDIVTGTAGRDRLPALAAACLHERQHICAVHAHSGGFEALPPQADAAHTRAFLKIQDGCDRYCAYCIIPYARGRSRSLPLTELQEALHSLRAQGFAEIVLCGIDLACYGQETGHTLADAVQLCAEAGFPRIRLGSLEPDGLTETVLRRLADIPGLCPHFHIALQSGCDRTLRAMGRRYACADYAALTETVRQLFPGAAVTTDLMAGFPGETEEDFAESLRFVRALSLAGLHGFRYSVRPGTRAADMPGQVPEAVKRERAERLHLTGAALHREFLQRCIGEPHEVLFERERGDGLHRGHAENYATVLVPSQGEDWRGSIRRVQITGIQGASLLGEIL